MRNTLCYVWLTQQEARPAPFQAEPELAWHAAQEVYAWCRLARIKIASGSEAAERLLKEILGKADFDLEEYDKAMAAAFDDEYYGVRAVSSERPVRHSPGLYLSCAW